MDTAVIGTSRKENEKRVAIHPGQIKEIPENIRKQLFFERGYGIPFGISDDKIALLTGNKPMKREMLFKSFKAFIIPKPVEEDFEEMSDGSVVWGWIHSIQNKKIAQIAIDKKLTLVAWENMYYKGKRNRVHIFQKNNEMAGYCGVQHVLQLRGIDGNFGLSRKIVILGYGSVSRGAIYALKGHGFNDITVCTKRPTYLVSEKIPGIAYEQVYIDESGCRIKKQNGEFETLINKLSSTDIIVNGFMQNINNPVIFVHDEDIIKFKKECIIIDISCDEGMGFSFAHPTTVSHPFYKLGNILYYSIDHTPSLLWDSASFEISSSLIPYLNDFIEEKDNDVLNDAVDIKNGNVVNKNILNFQKRSPIYPYKYIEDIQNVENNDVQDSIG